MLINPHNYSWGTTYCTLIERRERPIHTWLYLNMSLLHSVVPWLATLMSFLTLTVRQGVACCVYMCCAVLTCSHCRVCVCVCVQLTVLWATSANTEEKYLGGLDWDDRGAIAYVTWVSAVLLIINGLLLLSPHDHDDALSFSTVS